VEARAKLNTPGQKDGLNQLWIDGRLEAERKNLDWRGDYTGHGINAVFLETYWNDGSPVTQSRWIDNFVISTRPIGPVDCPRNPVLIKTPYHGPGTLAAWQVEVAAEDQENIVWRSNLLAVSERVRVGAEDGRFVGPLASQSRLEADRVYCFRVRQSSDRGPMSPWSPWHQAVRTADEVVK